MYQREQPKLYSENSYVTAVDREATMEVTDILVQELVNNRQKMSASGEPVQGLFAWIDLAKNAITKGVCAGKCISKHRHDADKSNIAKCIKENNCL